MAAATTDIAGLIHEFWARMGSNDFASVQSVLSDQFILEWPQSNERIRGAARFARMNAEYPAQGPWRFTVNRVVASKSHDAVSDVTVTDGALTARAISFFSVEAGKITKIVEYWPEPYAAPANRAHLVEPLD
jgi:ketosteroid isomerase-like protein